MKAMRGVIACLMLFGCASPHPIVPDVETVKVSRDKPSSKCKELGKVTGTTLSAKGKPEDALLNMKSEATSKGANYLQVLEYSEEGTSVTGYAYDCP